MEVDFDGVLLFLENLSTVALGLLVVQMKETIALAAEIPAAIAEDHGGCFAVVVVLAERLLLLRI